MLAKRALQLWIALQLGEASCNAGQGDSLQQRWECPVCVMHVKPQCCPDVRCEHDSGAHRMSNPTLGTALLRALQLVLAH